MIANDCGNNLILSKDVPLRKRVNLTRLSKEERYNYVKHLTLWHPKMHEIIKDISECQKNNISSDEPECMSLFGPPRVGKSYLVKMYLSKYPRYNNKVYMIPDDPTSPIIGEVTCVPVFYTKVVETPAAVGALASSMLEYLGHPINNARASIKDKTTLLKFLIRKCCVELIILDEVQHFVDRNKKQLLADTSDWFKSLIIDLNIPVLLVGTFEAKKIFTGNEQLNGRFLTRQELLPFNINSANDKAYFRIILQRIDDNLPLKDESMLSSSGTWEKLFISSNGRVPYLISLIRRSTQYALEMGIEKINHKIMEFVFDKHFSQLGICEGNPFSIDYNIDKAKEKFVSENLF